MKEVKELNAILFKMRDGIIDVEFGYVEPANDGKKSRYFFRDGRIDYLNKLIVKEPGVVYNGALYFMAGSKDTSVSYKKLKYKALKIYQKHYEDEIDKLTTKLARQVIYKGVVDAYLEEHYTSSELYFYEKEETDGINNL